MSKSLRIVFCFIFFVTAAAIAGEGKGPRTQKPTNTDDVTVIFRYDAVTQRMVRVGFAPSLAPHVSMNAQEAVKGPHGLVATRAGDASVTPLFMGKDSSGSVVVAMPLRDAAEITSVTLVGLRDLPGATESSSSFTLDARDVIEPANDDAKYMCLEVISYTSFDIPGTRDLCITCYQTCIGEFCGNWYYC